MALQNCKICKLTVFCNDPAIHYTCNYCSVLSQLCLTVTNFFWVKTLHLICLKLGLNVTNFQGTGPWSKMPILTAVHLEIDSHQGGRRFFSTLANLTLINKTIVHWELIILAITWSRVRQQLTIAPTGCVSCKDSFKLFSSTSFAVMESSYM